MLVMIHKEITNHLYTNLCLELRRNKMKRKGTFLLATLILLNTVIYGQNGSDFEIEGTVLMKYNGNEKKVIIPEGVTSIGDKAFIRCTDLTSITIPASITDMRSDTFDECEKLTEIIVNDRNTTFSSIEGVLYDKTKTVLFLYPQGKQEQTYVIPSGVKNIFRKAFNNCKSLTNITISGSVTTIGDNAFYSCFSLKRINIPESVTSIGYSAFLHCFDLKEITVDKQNTAYSSVRGVLFNKDKTTLVRYPADKSGFIYTIPARVTRIDDGAFSDCSLAKINIPKSVTSIGNIAFSDCLHLGALSYKITIPANITSIGNGVFMSCISIKRVVIPTSITSIGDSAFSNCSSLTSITIPASVTSIGDNAFTYCESLTSITIPASVTSIGEGAFIECNRLTSITIGSDVKLIDNENSNRFHGIFPSFDNGFENIYINGGKRAGTYTRPDTKSTAWTRQP